MKISKLNLNTLAVGSFTTIFSMSVFAKHCTNVSSTACTVFASGNQTQGLMHTINGHCVGDDDSVRLTNSAATNLGKSQFQLSRCIKAAANNIPAVKESLSNTCERIRVNPNCTSFINDNGNLQMSSKLVNGVGWTHTTPTNSSIVIFSVSDGQASKIKTMYPSL